MPEPAPAVVSLTDSFPEIRGAKGSVMTAGAS